MSRIAVHAARHSGRGAPRDSRTDNPTSRECTSLRNGDDHSSAWRRRHRRRLGHVVFLHEPNHHYRMVPLDNRPHPGPKIKLWMGDARGRWEGNTLVVDVTNFNERAWLWGDAIFHSDALHLVERFTPTADG